MGRAGRENETGQGCMTEAWGTEGSGGGDGSKDSESQGIGRQRGPFHPQTGVWITLKRKGMLFKVQREVMLIMFLWKVSSKPHIHGTKDLKTKSSTKVGRPCCLFGHHINWSEGIKRVPAMGCC